MHEHTVFRWVIAVVLMSSAFMVLASQPQGHGTVNMAGSIIDTACAIAVSDQHQAIKFGTETTGELMHDGHGPRVPFRIHLVNCSLKPSVQGRKDWSWFAVTFNGISDGGEFGVIGTEGVWVRIADLNGNVALPGVPLPAQQLVAGEQSLDFTLQLTSNHLLLRAGSWHTTVRLKVDYN